MPQFKFYISLLFTFLILGLVLSFLLDNRIVSAETGSFDARSSIQALEAKIDQVLQNQEKILLKLERIWKYK
jgi:cell division protein FtsL